jgi:hypothetical protein
MVRSGRPDRRAARFGRVQRDTTGSHRRRPVSDDRTRRPIELGSILRGVSKGRTNNDQITVCDLTGVGVQDTAIARYVYRQLLHQNRDIAGSSARDMKLTTRMMQGSGTN